MKKVETEKIKKLVEQGYNNIEIRDILKINHSTVIRHIRKIVKGKVNPNRIYRFDKKMVQEIAEYYLNYGTEPTCKKYNLPMKRLRRICEIARKHNLSRKIIRSRAVNFDKNFIEILKARNLVTDDDIVKKYHLSTLTYYRKLRKLGLININLLGISLTKFYEIYQNHDPKIQLKTKIKSKHGETTWVPWFYLEENNLPTPKVLKDYFEVMSLFQKFLHGPRPLVSLREVLRIFNN